MKKIINILIMLMALYVTGLAQAIPDNGAAGAVTLDPAEGVCINVAVDLATEACPVGAILDIDHTWQGDLAGFIAVGGERLALFTRPGTTACDGTGNGDASDPIGGNLIIFQDGGTQDSEMTVATGTAGDDGIAVFTVGDIFDPADSDCPGTVTSFAALCSALCTAGGGVVDYRICVTDHGVGDTGNLNSGTLIDGDVAVSGVACAESEVAVPTMGEWGLITLSLLILSMGTVLLFRRREERDMEVVAVSKK